MQNESTLIDLGFTHFPDYDFRDIGSKGYRLELNGKVWRAIVNDTIKPSGVSLGIVLSNNGKVDRWRDCFSNGSVEKHIYGK